MNDDGLPAETGPPVSEDLQQRGIDFLQELLASGKVDLDRFQKALDALLEVHTQADFASVVRSLPPPVEFTPPARRRQEPLEISTSMGEVRLEGRWQVSRLTKIDTGMGSVTIDLSQAEFDDWDVEIVVHTHMGTITVIVPRGLEVRPVGRSGAVDTALEPPIPGFPVVRLSATCDMGTIRVMHPTEKKQRRQRWRRRRSKGLLEKIDVPALVLHGEDDQIVPVHDAAKKSARLIKDATEIYYPGAPHGLTDTHADQFNADLLAFLRS